MPELLPLLIIAAVLWWVFGPSKEDRQRRQSFHAATCPDPDSEPCFKDYDALEELHHPALHGNSPAHDEVNSSLPGVDTQHIVLTRGLASQIQRDIAMRANSVFHEGDIVVHPNCPEWGPGRIVTIEQGQKAYIIDFINSGRKHLNLSSLNFDLIPWIREGERGEERHKRFMNATGHVYHGVSPASHKKKRVTHCWFCRSGLDNSIDIECRRCGWIICSCGACGCNYQKNRH